MRSAVDLVTQKSGTAKPVLLSEQPHVFVPSPIRGVSVADVRPPLFPRLETIAQGPRGEIQVCTGGRGSAHSALGDAAAVVARGRYRNAGVHAVGDAGHGTNLVVSEDVQAIGQVLRGRG